MAGSSFFIIKLYLNKRKRLEIKEISDNEMNENRLLPLKATLNVVNMVVRHFYRLWGLQRMV